MDGVSLIFTTCLFAAAGILGIRATQQWSAEKSRKVYDLSFPHNLTPKDATSFMRSLSGLLPMADRNLFGHTAVVFETWATGDGIRHRLHLPGSVAGQIMTQLRAAMPGVRITPNTGNERYLTKLTTGVELGMRGTRSPLRIPDPVAITTAILASFQPLGRGEAAVMQWVVAPTSPRRLSRPKRPSRQFARMPWLVQAILDLRQPPEVTPAQLAAIEAKQSEPLFTGICRVGANASSHKRARQIIRQVSAPLRITHSHASRFIRRGVIGRLAVRRIERAAFPILSFPVLVNAAELATVTGLPLESPILPGLRIGAARQLPPASTIPRSGHVIGEANFPGAERPVAIGIHESLRHIHAIGPTGSGKSTLLVNLMVQDMLAGRGLAVFDPKGDLISDVLDRIPAHRRDDVIVVDPTDSMRSIGLNLLENAGMANEVVVDQVVGVFKRLFAGFWGPRTDDVLRSTLLSLMQTPGTTLCDVPLVLQDPTYRAKILERVDDPIGLKPFWDWYERLSEKERSSVVGPVASKLRALLLRRSVRDMFGQSTSSVDLGDVLAHNKILLVNLPKGQIGEDTSALLGSMLVMKLWQEAQKRGTLPAQLRTPFTCYIDEFQDYLNLPSSISDILAQARGFGLSLVMAHQHLGQLTKEVKDAVMANARSKVVFQTNAADARSLADEFDPYLSASDLQNLAPYQAMALIYVEGQKAAPVSISTAPIPATTCDGAAVRAASGRRFGRARSDIEQGLRIRLVAEYTEPPETGREDLA